MVSGDGLSVTRWEVIIGPDADVFHLVGRATLRQELLCRSFRVTSMAGWAVTQDGYGLTEVSPIRQPVASAVTASGRASGHSALEKAFLTFQNLFRTGKSADGQQGGTHPGLGRMPGMQVFAHGGVHIELPEPGRLGTALPSAQTH